MIIEFALPIFYTQVLLHDATHPSPGLNWDDTHVAQGFAWSPGLVSFGVPDHDGECLIRVFVEPDKSVDEAAIWAIRVPYTVTGPLELGTVGLLQPIAISDGTYDVVFEALPGDADRDIAYVLSVTFVPTTEPEFAILRQGGEITTADVLRVDADLSVPVE